MQILPVLDLMAGQIVRGVAGRRDEYKPIVSKLTSSTEPVAVALALRKHFGFDEFYLADLDAIQEGKPNLLAYQKLQTEGFRLWIDAGVCRRDSLTLKLLIIAKAASVVVGLESIQESEDLGHIVRRVGSARTVFSLDLKEGKPLGNAAAWQTDDPFSIAQRAIEKMGVSRMIVLDLARVGVGVGAGTEDLCARIKRAYPHVSLSAGGGVRGIEDVVRMGNSGVDRVLVASALHDGRITPADVSKSSEPPA